MKDTLQEIKTGTERETIEHSTTNIKINLKSRRCWKCWRCKYQHPFGKCPAWKNICDNCKKRHHYSHCCPEAKLIQDQISGVTNSSAFTENENLNEATHQINSEKIKDIFQEIKSETNMKNVCDNCKKSNHYSYCCPDAKLTEDQITGITNSSKFKNHVQVLSSIPPITAEQPEIKTFAPATALKDLKFKKEPCLLPERCENSLNDSTKNDFNTIDSGNSQKVPMSTEEDFKKPLLVSGQPIYSEMKTSVLATALSDLKFKKELHLLPEKRENLPNETTKNDFNSIDSGNSQKMPNNSISTESDIKKQPLVPGQPSYSEMKPSVPASSLKELRCDQTQPYLLSKNNNNLQIDSAKNDFSTIGSENSQEMRNNSISTESNFNKPPMGFEQVRYSEIKPSAPPACLMDLRLENQPHQLTNKSEKLHHDPSIKNIITIKSENSQKIEIVHSSSSTDFREPSLLIGQSINIEIATPASSTGTWSKMQHLPPSYNSVYLNLATEMFDTSAEQCHQNHVTFSHRCEKRIQCDCHDEEQAASAKEKLKSNSNCIIS